MRTDARLRNAVRTLERLRSGGDRSLHLPLDTQLTLEELNDLALLIRKVIETRAKLERLRARAEHLRASLERFRERQSSA